MDPLRPRAKGPFTGIAVTRMTVDAALSLGSALDSSEDRPIHPGFDGPLEASIEKESNHDPGSPLGPDDPD